MESKADIVEYLNSLPIHILAELHSTEFDSLIIEDGKITDFETN